MEPFPDQNQPQPTGSDFSDFELPTDVYLVSKGLARNGYYYAILLQGVRPIDISRSRIHSAPYMLTARSLT